MPVGRQNWAVVVGINEYPQAAGQTVLLGAVADAADFADWALQKDGGEVAPERLFFWTHPAPASPSPDLQAYLQAGQPQWFNGTQPDFTRAPTSVEVVETALKVAQDCKIAAMEDEEKIVRRCYVFFAGHGVQTHASAVQEQQTCFVLGNFVPSANMAGGLIPCQELFRGLLALGFDEVVMFLDCCRNGAARLNMPVQSLMITQSKQPERPVYVLAAASQMGEPAYETADEPFRGAFSKTLVEALRTERGPRGELSFEGLRACVNAKIGKYTNRPQRPSFDGRPDNPWPVILHERGAARPQTAEIRIDSRGLQPESQIRVLDGFSAVVQGPISPSPEIVVVTAPFNRLYCVEVVGTPHNDIFRLGPEGHDVRF